jgi:hypothetical protein
MPRFIRVFPFPWGSAALSSTIPNQAIIDLVGFTLIGIATMQADALA